MGTTGTYVPRGLYTNSNPYSEVPPGALATAENVVHRTRGLLEPRPGYTPTNLTDGDVDEIFPFDNDVALMQSPSAVPQIQWRSDASIVVFTGQTLESGRTFSAQARGNLYINGETDVIKVTGAQVTTFATAGIEGPALIEFVSFVNGDGLDTLKDVRLAATLERTDANEVIVTSPPSTSFISQNKSGASVTVTYRIYMPPGALAGDIMRLFKSEEVTNDTTPSEQMLLTEEAEITSADISSGFIDVVDDTVTGDRGATIYTAPSRGGISGANDRPPVCKDIAVFKNSLFFANTRQPHQVTFSWDAKIDRSTFVAGIGQRNASGTATITSPIITAQVDTSGVEVGMFYESISGNIPDAAVVIAVTATTITVDVDATGSGAEVSNIYDSVKIDGITYAAGIPQTLVAAINIGTDSSGFVLNNNGGVPDPNVFATSRSALVTGTAGFPTAEFAASVKLERRDGTDTSFEIKATHGSEYTPIIPQPDVSPGLLSTADTRPNGIYWSKVLQPEHVPLLNFVEVGDGSEIQRIVPARDALWVFKKDGIFRLTGNGAGTTAADADWRVDPFDRSRFLATIKSPAVLDDVVFAWTNRGVAMITDAGVTDISQDTIQDQIFRDQSVVIDNPTFSNVPFAWGFAHQAHNEYWFRPGRTISLETIYIFNVHNKTWTTQELPDAMVSAAYRPDTSQALFGGSITADFDLWEEKTSEQFLFGFADQEFNTTNTIDGNGVDVTITADPDSYTPQVGDCVLRATEMRTISAVASPTEYTVAAAFSVTGAGQAITSAAPVTQTIEYQWHSQGNPGQASNFYIVTWAFSKFKGIPQIAYDFITPLSDTRVTQTRVLPPESGSVADTVSGPFELRAYVDINHARTTQIRPRIQINAACGNWQHAGIQYISNDVGEKVDQR